MLNSEWPCAVIFYNTALLSKVYEQKLAAGEQAAINALRVSGQCPTDG